MERKYYTGKEGESEIHIASVPLESFRLSSLVISFINLVNDNDIDDYTLNQFRHFYEFGFTETAVKEAPASLDDDKMFLFAYDENFTSPIGLAICFNGKFYSLGYSKGKRSEAELYSIYKTKKEN